MNHSIGKYMFSIFIASMLLIVILTSGHSALAKTISPSLDSQNVAEQPLNFRAPLAPDVVQSSFQIPGSVFLTVDSGTSLVYDFFGCTHPSAGAGNLINAPLDVPDGATLVGMRMFYDDTSTNNLTGAVTRFNSAGTDQEIIKTVSSTYASGHGNNYVGLDNHIVDTYSWSYVLTVYFNNVASTQLQFCSFLITYYAP